MLAVAVAVDCPAVIITRSPTALIVTDGLIAAEASNIT